MSNQNPFDLPKKSDRQEYHHEVYAPSKSEQLHSTLEEVLGEQKEKEKRTNQW
ncbi:hypothetical protein [Corynebacterium comes]|uniref:Uncharacterized protein n=1 Tax=Corynebacterium comes TaxID=2675218 RepID=A0A6B8VM33_9CORY|nr:hypothetical protein [Corynebacterium comes]QGU05103.1 hypothetical protein CETAM_09250 [Corynebacterium comes]